MESSTSNNQWSGRVLRIGTFVVLVVIFLAVGRFATYKLMLSEGGIECPRTTSVEKIVDVDESDIGYAFSDREYSDNPFSILLNDGGRVVEYKLDLNDDKYTGTVTVSKPSCGWLDDFGADEGDFASGHFVGLIMLFFTAVFTAAAVFVLMGLASLAVYLWNGRPESSDDESEESTLAEHECSDPSCRCGYHQVAEFDQERQEWFVHCRDGSCGCSFHADETFDETKNEWV